MTTTVCATGAPPSAAESARTIGQTTSPLAIGSVTYRAGAVISSFAMTDQKNGPLEQDSEGVRGSYVRGGYQALLKVPGSLIFDSDALPGNTGYGANIRVEVDVTFVLPSPAEKPNVGLVCFYYLGDENRGAYLFYVTPSGDAFIGRASADRSDPVTLENLPQPSAAIRATLTNHIQADCVQDGGSVVLVLSVNGTELLRARDTNPGHISEFGNAAFSLVSAPQPGFSAIFSNFRVTEMLRV